MYVLKAYNEDGEQVLNQEINGSQVDAELKFENISKAAKRNGYFHITLSNEYALIRGFAR